MNIRRITKSQQEANVRAYLATTPTTAKQKNYFGNKPFQMRPQEQPAPKGQDKVEASVDDGMEAAHAGEVEQKYHSRLPSLLINQGWDENTRWGGKDWSLTAIQVYDRYEEIRNGFSKSGLGLHTNALDRAHKLLKSLSLVEFKGNTWVAT